MSVLDEDIGHPAYRPDRDLVEEIVVVLNKHGERLTIGNLFGSLLVAMRCVIYTRTTARAPTPRIVRALMHLASEYMVRPPRVDEDPSLIIKVPPRFDG